MNSQQGCTQKIKTIIRGEQDELRVDGQEEERERSLGLTQRLKVYKNQKRPPQVVRLELNCEYTSRRKESDVREIEMKDQKLNNENPIMKIKKDEINQKSNSYSRKSTAPQTIQQQYNKCIAKKEQILSNKKNSKATHKTFDSNEKNRQSYLRPPPYVKPTYASTFQRKLESKSKIQSQLSNKDKIKELFTYNSIERFEKQRKKFDIVKAQQNTQRNSFVRQSKVDSCDSEVPFLRYQQQRSAEKPKRKQKHFKSIDDQFFPLGQTDIALESFDPFDASTYHTVDAQTIEDGRNNKIQVSIAIPTRNETQSEKKSYSFLSNQGSQQNGGGLSVLHSKRRSVLTKGRPPKPCFETGSRRDYQGHNEALSSFMDHSSSTLSIQRTQPQPFNLSRSNSRRNKRILFQEKQKKEKQDELHLQQIVEEKQRKQSLIPTHHYIPSLVVLKSTKGLTNFKEFNLNTNSRLSKLSKDLSQPKLSDQQQVQQPVEDRNECLFEQNNDSFLGQLLQENELDCTILI